MAAPPACDGGQTDGWDIWPDGEGVRGVLYVFVWDTRRDPWKRMHDKPVRGAQMHGLTSLIHVSLARMVAGDHRCATRRGTRSRTKRWLQRDNRWKNTKVGCTDDVNRRV